MEERKINVSFIVEILGRPKEHLKTSLEGMLGKLDEEKGVTIIEKKIHEPKEFENKVDDSEKKDELKEKIESGNKLVMENKLFTTFAEVEVELDDLNALMVLSFNYMPSNIEINYPEHFVLKNSDIGGILTNTILRLHRYDEIVKKITIDKKILEEKIKELIEKK